MSAPVADPTLAHRASAHERRQHSPERTLVWVGFRVGDGLPLPVGITPGTDGSPMLLQVHDDADWCEWASVLDLGEATSNPTTDGLQQHRCARSTTRPIELRLVEDAS